jgi:SAM-dependent methyltransferase
LSEPPLSRSLPKFVKTGIALDIGCGQGLYTSLLLKKGYSVIGIDINRLRLQQASKFADVILADCHALPFKNCSFDLVCMLQVLHHIKKPQVALDEISRLSKNGGVLYLTEVVEDNPLFKLSRSIKPAWEGDPVRTRLTRKELRRMLNERFSLAREDTSYGYFYWFWAIFPVKFNRDIKIISKLIRFVDRQLDRILEHRFSCTYHAVFRKQADHFSSF